MNQVDKLMQEALAGEFRTDAIRVEAIDNFLEMMDRVRVDLRAQGVAEKDATGVIYIAPILAFEIDRIVRASISRPTPAPGAKGELKPD